MAKGETFVNLRYAVEFRWYLATNLAQLEDEEKAENNSISEELSSFL